MRFEEFGQLIEGPSSWLGKLIPNIGKKAAGKIGGKAAASTAASTAAKTIAPKVSSVSSAKKFISTLGDKANIALNLYGAYELTKFIINYQDLSHQKELAESGDTSTAIFGKTPKNQIESVYNTTLEKYAGETALASLPLLLKVPAKLFSITGTILSATGSVAGGVAGGAGGYTALGVPGAFVGYQAGKSLGKLAGVPLKGAAGITKMLSGGATGALFLAFLQTDMAKEFFKTALQGQLIELVGGITVGLYRKAASIIDSYFSSNNTGSAPTTVGGKTGSSQSGTSAKAKAPDVVLSPEKQKLEQEYDSSPLVVRFDRQNPNIMYVNNLPVTDENGFRAVGKPTIDRIGVTASGINKPNPVANLPTPARYSGGYY